MLWRSLGDREELIVGCSSCRPRQTIHQVRFADGTVLRYATEADAKAKAAKTPGAQYQKVQR